MRSSRASRCRSRMTRLRSAAPAPCSRPRLVRAHGVACFTRQCNTSMSARLGLDITHLASPQWHSLDVLREADRTRGRAGQPGGYYSALESSCRGRAVHERGGANVCLPAACGARQCGTSNASCPRPRTPSLSALSEENTWASGFMSAQTYRVAIPASDPRHNCSQPRPSQHDVEEPSRRECACIYEL